MLFERSIKEYEMGRARGTRGVTTILYRLLAGTHDLKRRLGIRGCRLESNIKMDSRGIGWRAWTGLI